MTLLPFSRPTRKAAFGALPLALCLAGWVAPTPSWANDLVELSPARYAPSSASEVRAVARLVLDGDPVLAARQPNNINHRLVNYPPALPMPERRAAAQAVEAARWQRFAEATLQDGDVLFRLGNARTHLVMNFSRLTAFITASRYSHTGIFRWSGDRPEVVDITESGIRVQAFPTWMREVADNEFAVRRLKPAYRDRIPEVLAYLQDRIEARPQFDYKFDLGNDEYYCVELTERAFRAAGLPLSEPVPADDLPRADQIPVWMWLVRTVGGVDTNNPVFVAGNDDYGVYASDKLEAVFCSADAEPEGFRAPVPVAILPNTQ